VSVERIAVATGSGAIIGGGAAVAFLASLFD